MLDERLGGVGDDDGGAAPEGGGARFDLAFVGWSVAERTSIAELGRSGGPGGPDPPDSGNWNLVGGALSGGAVA